MAKRLFVGRLPYEVTNSQLEELFSQAGKVESVNVITDRFSGQGKGFAFVEMTSDGSAQAAIDALNGTEVKGRSINVSIAREKSNDDRGGGFRSSGGGGFKKRRDY